MRRKFTGVERAFQVVGAMQVVVGLACMVTIGIGFGILLATLGLLGMFRPYRDRWQYNAGWMSGRTALVRSMSEAQARGMHPVEWLVAEAERDGFRVKVTPAPECGED